jgi:hypothetical protein
METGLWSELRREPVGVLDALEGEEEEEEEVLELNLGDDIMIACCCSWIVVWGLLA